MWVAVVGTGAAGVKDSLLRSGSSSDFRRRGELGRWAEGEVGLDVCGDIWAGRWGMGRRRLGRREEEGVVDGVIWEECARSPLAWPRAGEPCWAEGVLPIFGGKGRADVRWERTSNGNPGARNGNGRSDK